MIQCDATTSDEEGIAEAMVQAFEVILEDLDHPLFDITRVALYRGENLELSLAY